MTKAGTGEPTVAVVIPVFNQARFLGDALASVFSQTRQADEVIVVDDGSTDDPAAILADYPSVRFVRQENAGASAARNRGLAETSAAHVLFLDADDQLTPAAIEQGLRCMARNPECAFGYGGYLPVDADLQPLGPARYQPCGAEPWRDLLRGNFIGNPSVAMFERTRLFAAGGFDQDIRACEDYELFLRLARLHPVASHPAIVAKYRQHGGSTSPDQAGMLSAALAVLDRNRPSPGDNSAMRAWRDGRRRWRLLYAKSAWRDRASSRARLAIATAAPVESVIGLAAGVARRVLPAKAFRAVRDLTRTSPSHRGPVDLGDLARDEPVSRRFGYDRGTPIDRWYVERFLAAHSPDIRGRVLEVGDATYSQRFGSAIEQQDIFDRPHGNPAATLTGDLTQPGVLPENAFDCLVITQVLQLLYDGSAAVKQFHEALKPGGIILLTVPGVTAVDPAEWDGEWFWSYTRRSAERLFEEHFGRGQAEIALHGNVFAATCFLQGLAVEEIEAGLLERDDPAYPFLISVRARKRG